MRRIQVPDRTCKVCGKRYFCRCVDAEDIDWKIKENPTGLIVVSDKIGFWSDITNYDGLTELEGILDDQDQLNLVKKAVLILDELECFLIEKHHIQEFDLKDGKIKPIV